MEARVRKQFGHNRIIMIKDQLTRKEEKRIQELMNIIPRGRSTVLDIGAREGRISRLLTLRFKTVTALDLIKPHIDHPNIIPVAGNVINLDFPDNYFDTVFCAEVLEHLAIESIEKACREIVRVAKYDVIIGVPYKQDLRVGRTTCGTCHRNNPPWGHMNSFDEKKLRKLFTSLTPVTTSYVGSSKSRTNALSSYLMNIAGNPWGTYDQKEACIFCGAKLSRPSYQGLNNKMCSKFAAVLTQFQQAVTTPKPVWMHSVYMKNPF